MTTNLLGSPEETDSDDPEPVVLQAEPAPSINHAKKNSFTSAKYDTLRQFDTLDRRKVERNIGITPPHLNGPIPPADSRQGSLKKQAFLAPNHDIDKMSDIHNRRRSRTRNPWSSSPMTITITFLAVVFSLAIIHAFLTRQLDPKGCDMCWSRPIYFKFSDFDTEHTRFASKYHLYLHREGAFDEDPKVGASRSSTT